MLSYNINWTRVAKHGLGPNIVRSYEEECFIW